jgi:hypothetical protein
MGMPLNPRTEERISAAPKLIKRNNREKNSTLAAPKLTAAQCPIAAVGMLLDPRNM